jgi:hypothetical protein
VSEWNVTGAYLTTTNLVLVGNLNATVSMPRTSNDLVEEYFDLLHKTS